MQLTLSQKTENIKRTFEQYREWVSVQELLDMDAEVMRQSQVAAAAGNIDAYVALVQTALGLRRVLSANDRTALMAATLTNSGNTRVLPLDEE